MEHPRGVYGTPIEIKIKHPSEALFVIVLKTPTKELSELPIFNSVYIVCTICTHAQLAMQWFCFFYSLEFIKLQIIVEVHN